ncbi:unnamed protein product [Tuber aestivum]|uniref:C2H2-type domain-containing protein n=1 Tax=Tuber aestivum TaxID=59557 RepID=A0A292Q6J5_9PEZI|nr:unnamed protein product [Tuber aestivum]
MTLHRITTAATTTNLPSIGVHDHHIHNMDMSSESYRSRPLAIPAPRNISPTSSRASSLHDQPPPPPLLSLLPSAPSNRFEERQASWKDSDDGDESMPRRWFGDVRDRQPSSHPISSPRGWGSCERKPRSPRHTSPGNFGELDIKREPSQSWPDDFRGRQKPPSQLSKDRLQGEDSMRVAMRASVRAFDKGLIGKLNDSARSAPSPLPRQRITPPRDSRPVTLGSVSDDLPLPLTKRWDHLKSQLRGGSTSNPIPIPGPGSLNTPFQRWQHTPSVGDNSGLGMAPEQHPPVFPSFSDIRNSGDNASVSSFVTDNESYSGADSRMRRSRSASILAPGIDDAQSGSCDLYQEDTDSQMDDAPSHVSQMKRLTLGARTPPKSNSYPTNHRHQRAGSKRRASSPPNGDRQIGSSEPTRKGLHLEGYGSSDIYDHTRRTSPIHQGLRNSPKYQHFNNPPIPRSGSGSFASASISSVATWSTSLGQFSAASSFTTAGGVSPASSFSPPLEMEIVGGDQPPRQPPPSASAKGPSTSRHRQIPEASPALDGREREGLASKHHSAPKMGVFMCECCPKKPKKFDTQTELQLHEMEKQYGCQYCNNRFKNKNEAERHQNSLHLRKHSWSCAVLSSDYSAAFHASPQHPSTCEICGYCGKEFPMPPQWGQRIDHLTGEHKFGECNQSKKFYRADHFRQHLKHSHSGTSGKWTNVLENACMKDEMPPTASSHHANMGSGTTMAISEEGSE